MMFSDENKMGGLSLIYESSDILSIEKWLCDYYKCKIKITKPENGIRYITDLDDIHFSCILIQENKKYKVYG